MTKSVMVLRPVRLGVGLRRLGLLGFGVLNPLDQVGPGLDLLTSGRAGFCQVGTGLPALGNPDLYIYICKYVFSYICVYVENTLVIVSLFVESSERVEGGNRKTFALVGLRALVGRALVCPCGPGPHGPDPYVLGPCGPGPYGPGSYGPAWALVGRTLMGLPGPLLAAPSWASLGPYGPGPY